MDKSSHAGAAAPPERLDQLIRVTRPWVWISLFAFGLILITACGWLAFGTVADTIEAPGVLMRKGGAKTLKASFGEKSQADNRIAKGTIAKWLVAPGQSVRKNEPLVEIRLGEKNLTVSCPVENAVILRQAAREGEEVNSDDALLFYELGDEPMQVLLYPSINSGYRAEPEMKVHISPANAKRIESGYLLGRIVSAGKFPVSERELTIRLQNEALARQLLAAGPSLQVLVELESDSDPQSRSGARWSSPTGRNVPLYSGIPCQARLIIRESSPIKFAFPALSEHGH